MTKAELEAYRESLLALRDRHNGDASHLADEGLRRTGGGASGNLSNMPIHMADLGTDNFEHHLICVSTKDFLPSNQIVNPHNSPQPK